MSIRITNSNRKLSDPKGGGGSVKGFENQQGDLTDAAVAEEIIRA